MLVDTPRYWALQAAGWLAVQVALFSRHLPEAATLGAAPAEVAVPFLIGTGLAVVLSSGLALVYLRLPESGMSGARATTTLLPLSILAALPWSAGMALFFSYQPWAAAVALPMLPRGLVAQASLLFAGWSAVFMVCVVRVRVDRAQERAEALARQAEIEALRTQLKPRFLFGTLRSLVGLVVDRPAQARQLVRDVSELLRRALSSDGADTTSLHEELGYVHRYLRCEAIQREGPLDVEIDVPLSLLRAPVPTTLLQQLVEHATRSSGEPGVSPRIVVRASLSRGTLLLEVRHPSAGPPMTPRGDASGALPDAVGVCLTKAFPESAQLHLRKEADMVVIRASYPLTSAHLSLAS